MTKQTLFVWVATGLLAAGTAAADTPEIDENGLGFLFARYAGSAGQCDTSYVTRAEARLTDGFGTPVSWIGHLRIPDGQATREFGQPAGFHTYQVIGIQDRAGGDESVVVTYAYLRDDLRSLMLVRPDRLNRPPAAGSRDGGLFLPADGVRIDPANPPAALLSLTRCDPAPLDASLQDDDDLAADNREDPTKLPAVRVVRDVNYRSRPDGSAGRLGFFLRGQILKTYGLVDGWYRFRVDGEDVYSFADFFRPVD
ncbi:MAG: hypothetical protein KDK12_09985 [Rhodobacteraceae bacterium]|nr:hypothetical protein [Paracoccaceae bacterium]